VTPTRTPPGKAAGVGGVFNHEWQRRPQRRHLRVELAGFAGRGQEPVRGRLDPAADRRRRPVGGFLQRLANSQHGLACDGRQVPQIVAPGCSTDSTSTGSGYDLNCGTWMASPVVSGAVALYWQPYRQRFGVDPSPAMLKAAFTPVAVDLIGSFDADNGVLGHRRTASRAGAGWTWMR